MSEALLMTLIIVTSACSGIAGGVYFSFAAIVMPALRRVQPYEAVSAMQSINVAAVRWPFMIIFFGSMIGSVAMLVMDMAAGDWVPAAIVRVIGAALGIAAFSITVLGNVPLNNRLASDRGSSSAAGSWTSFHLPWSRFNLARAILSMAVPVVLGYSLVM